MRRYRLLAISSLTTWEIFDTARLDRTRCCSSARAECCPLGVDISAVGKLQRGTNFFTTEAVD